MCLEVAVYCSVCGGLIKAAAGADSGWLKLKAIDLSSKKLVCPGCALFVAMFGPPDRRAGLYGKYKQSLN